MIFNVAVFIGYLVCMALLLGIVLLGANAGDVTFMEGALVSLMLSPLAVAMSMAIGHWLRPGGRLATGRKGLSSPL